MALVGPQRHRGEKINILCQIVLFIILELYTSYFSICMYFCDFFHFKTSFWLNSGYMEYITRTYVRMCVCVCICLCACPRKFVWVSRISNFEPVDRPKRISIWTLRRFRPTQIGRVEPQAWVQNPASPRIIYGRQSDIRTALLTTTSLPPSISIHQSSISAFHPSTINKC